MLYPAPICQHLAATCSRCELSQSLVLSLLCFEHLFFNWYRQDFLTLRKDSGGASRSLFLSLFQVMVQPVFLYKHLPVVLMRNMLFTWNILVLLVCRCLMEQQ